MGFNIDYNRGVMKLQDNATGVSVYMYLDDPGVYLSGQGTEVDISLARQAGFEVDKQLKQKLLKERLATAMAGIQAELETGEKDQTVLLERDGFKLVDLGLGRHQVLSPDGDSLVPNPLPKEQATLLFEQLVPKAKPEPKAKVQKPA